MLHLHVCETSFLLKVYDLRELMCQVKCRLTRRDGVSPPKPGSCESNSPPPFFLVTNLVTIWSQTADWSQLNQLISWASLLLFVLQWLPRDRTFSIPWSIDCRFTYRAKWWGATNNITIWKLTCKILWATREKRNPGITKKNCHYLLSVKFLCGIFCTKFFCAPNFLCLVLIVPEMIFFHVIEIQLNELGWFLPWCIPANGKPYESRILEPEKPVSQEGERKWKGCLSWNTPSFPGPSVPW